ncbi:MAG: helix-hairpin-helix domain-containing protein [Prevotella sp.]|nr:helix-hairpin-helix domain-containing protein [Prevotella sp.]
MNRNDRRIAVAAIAVATLAIGGILCAGRRDMVPTRSAPAAEAVGIIRRARPYHVPSVSAPVAEAFPFDPNTADSTELLRLGLRPWQVRSIYKYRARGGIYRRKEDFARLYGLTVKDYRRLEPYIRIGQDYQPAATLVPDRPFGIDSVIYPKKIDTTQRVVLNTADTTVLRTVPGIGKHFAHEIMKHGRRLGGYVSVDQLDEIDYFPQSSKRYFIIQQPAPQRLNINQLTLSQLRRHPYINFYQAKAIVEYRRLHGPLKSLHDLRLSRDFPPEQIARLEPYVSF